MFTLYLPCQFSFHPQCDRGLGQIQFQVGPFNQVQKGSKCLKQGMKRVLRVKDLMGANVISKNRDT